MRTETLMKLLSKLSNLFKRNTTVRLDKKEYSISHVEHKDDKDVIVIYEKDDD